MGRLSREKGRAFEREMAARFRTIPGVEAQVELRETQQGNLGDLRLNLPLAVQCKVGIQPPVYEALREAQAVSQRGLCVALIRKNQGKGSPKADLAVLPLDQYFQILRLLHMNGLLRALR